MRAFALAAALLLGSPHPTAPMPVDAVSRADSLDAALDSLRAIEGKLARDRQVSSESEALGYHALAHRGLDLAHDPASWVRPHPLEQAWLEYYAARFLNIAWIKYTKELGPWLARLNSQGLAAARDTALATNDLYQAELQTHLANLLALSTQTKTDSVPWIRRRPQMRSMLTSIDHYTLKLLVETQYCPHALKAGATPFECTVLLSALHTLDLAAAVNSAAASALSEGTYARALDAAYAQHTTNALAPNDRARLLTAHRTALATLLNAFYANRPSEAYRKLVDGEN